MMVYKKLSLLLSILTILLFTGCDSPDLFGEEVEKTYFTGGQVSSTYTWSDKSGKNGILRKYGYEGHMTSSVRITNGVKDGIETMYDPTKPICKWEDTRCCKSILPKWQQNDHLYIPIWYEARICIYL